MVLRPIGRSTMIGSRIVKPIFTRHCLSTNVYLLLRGVLGLHVRPDVGVGVHVDPELAEEGILVDEVGGEATEDAALEPAEQPPHGDVRDGHGLAHEESRRPVVLEDLVEGLEVLGHLAVVGNQLGPGRLLLLLVLHPHGRAHLNGHVGRRVDDLVDLGGRKVIILRRNILINESGSSFNFQY